MASYIPCARTISPLVVYTNKSESGPTDAVAAPASPRVSVGKNKRPKITTNKIITKCS